MESKVKQVYNIYIYNFTLIDTCERIVMHKQLMVVISMFYRLIWFRSHQTFSSTFKRNESIEPYDLIEKMTHCNVPCTYIFLWAIRQRQLDIFYLSHSSYNGSLLLVTRHIMRQKFGSIAATQRCKNKWHIAGYIFHISSTSALNQHYKWRLYNMQYSCMRFASGYTVPWLSFEQYQTHDIGLFHHH